MNLLLDTNALLWSLSSPDRLSDEARRTLEREDTTVFFSQVSLLEIQIKLSVGKLRLDIEPEQLPGSAEASGFLPLRLENGAIFLLGKLPLIHRDPFDRLLVCESIYSGAALVTPDPWISKYPVKILW